MTKALDLFKTWWFIVVFLFALGAAWTTFGAKLESHFTETSELTGINREMCYAMHKHAGLDPSGCYDPNRRGRKW